jgi:two-component system sensor histidine kinase DegS
LMIAISLFTQHGVTAFRCFGNVLVPATQDRPAIILLRLFPGLDGRFSAGAQRLGKLIAEQRWWLAVHHSNEMRQEQLRLIGQYTFLANSLKVLADEKCELEDHINIVQAEERKRIAQDVHDQTGQELSTAIFELRRMRDHARGPNRDRLECLANDLANVGHRLHGAVVGSHPRIVEELGLKRAIKTTAGNYARDGGLELVFSSSGNHREPFCKFVESAVFRVAQEAMTNILKHARSARKLDVHLTFNNSFIVLAVNDDGAGFAMESRLAGAPAGAGLGFWSMRRRMTSVGGTLNVMSVVDRGTTVVAIAPSIAELTQDLGP